MKITIKAIEIYEFNILFETFNKRQLLFPRSLFPADIKKGYTEILDSEGLNNKPVIHNLGFNIGI